jgi:hypothetical protein
MHKTILEQGHESIISALKELTTEVKALRETLAGTDFKSATAPSIWTLLRSSLSGK